MQMGSIRSGGGASNEAATGVDAGAFRGVMRQLAGCVTVISTEEEGTLYGFTATAVCSVCAEPPTILIAVNKTARTHPHIDRKGAYAVNILADGQKHIAEHFAGKGDDQFATVEYALGAHGVPLINGAAAHLECEITQRIEIGTHTLFVGHVIGTGVDAVKPLIYHDAKYGLISHL
ncbi:flavin reductase [Hyphomicrobium methylovorum]|uniref:flavin reductase family protein n=1 Tax=Hyphomicrobium methylovorum TaxID=84 RepID=UPI0015E6CBE4|nr:flavin reductase family protein [Hyphomicrobium methylovorum]MBA2125183.1 flavin reductase [Hyphomicrobium methylovorum]